MIQDFYEAVLKGRETKSKEEEEQTNVANSFESNRPIVREGAEKLAASIIAQNEPKPPKVLTQQEQADNKAKAEKDLAEAIKQNKIIQA